MPLRFRKGNTQRKPLSQDEIGSLFLLAAIIFGAWFRLYPVYMAGFPINDGGLFYRITETILENGFYLPRYVEYNGLEIPFAYPPLGFYIAGILKLFLGVKLIQIFIYLPAVILIFSLFAFFSLANSLFRSKLQAGLATFIFALLPRSITWAIMGGGVTRSFGQLFLILAVRNIYCLYIRRTRKYLLFSILFSSLVCLSHPEAALHTIAYALVIWILKGRDKDGVIYTAAVAGGTLLLTSIWWLPTIINLGTTPFVSAAKTGLNSFNVLLFLMVSWSEEPFLPIIAVLAILGMAVKIVQQDYLIPLWYIIPFFIEPRNAANVAAIPMALLASVALTNLIFPHLAKIESQVRKIEFQQSIQSRVEKGILAYLVISMLTAMHFYDLTLIDRKVSQENQKAFQWVKNNLPGGSKILVVTGNSELFADWTLEWFPTLTNRTSLTTIQGYEWLGGSLFEKHLRNSQMLQRCVTQSAPLDCIERYSFTLSENYNYTYIYVAKKAALENYSTTIRGDTLIHELTLDEERYKKIYQTKDVVIFKRLP